MGLISTTDYLTRKNVRFDVFVLEGHSHVDSARNHAFRHFLESECTDLFFIDSDVGWNAKDFYRTLTAPGDVVAGVHRHKKDEETYPLDVAGEERHVNEHGLHPMPKVGTGFMRLKREVVQALYDFETKRGRVLRPKEDASDRMPVAWIAEHAFTAELGIDLEDTAKFNSEDYVICLKARSLGFTVFADLEIPLKHTGEKTWYGRCGDYLRREQKLDSPRMLAAMQKLRDGDSDLQVFHDLTESIEGWPLTPHALKEAYERAKGVKGHVLECGSGISTLVIGLALQGTPYMVHAIEEDLHYFQELCRRIERYRLNNIVAHYAPLMPYEGFNWYGLDLDELPANFALALIDGPHKPKEREGVYKLLGERIKNAVVIVDDKTISPTPDLPAHTLKAVESGRAFWIAEPNGSDLGNAPRSAIAASSAA